MIEGPPLPPEQASSKWKKSRPIPRGCRKRFCSEASEASIPRDWDNLIRCTYCKFAPCLLCIPFRTKQAEEGVLFGHLIIRMTT